MYLIFRTLSRLAVQKDLKTEVAYNQAVLQQVGVPPGDSILLLDGLILQEDDMNVFRWVWVGCRDDYLPCL